MQPSAPALCARDVSVSISGRRILKDVSFDVPQGTFLGVLGPNGTGKTTLLRAMAGLIPCRGSLQLMGRPLAEWPAREKARKLAMIAQDVPVSFDFTVQDLVLLGRFPHKKWLAPYDRTDREMARDALRMVDMENLSERSILTLSGGERRRALLAQTLAQDARVLLLDEPTSNLDVHHQYEFMGHVRKLVDDGRTAVGVFHDMELAARFADALIVLEEGMVAAKGSPEQVLEADVIRRVFRMEADVSQSEGALRIDFRHPVRNGHRGPA